MCEREPPGTELSMQCVTQFEIHAPHAKDLLQVFNRGSVIFQWISILHNSLLKFHTPFVLPVG